MHGHTHGDGHVHSHSAGFGPDPDHDHDLETVPNEENPIWQQENVTLRSVGIDVGSSGTQVVFSEIKLQRSGAKLAVRFVVVERSCLFQSAIAFTPFADSGLIDARALGALIDEMYRVGGIVPEDVDTGVVILTGEALRRENAESIAEVISARAGDFVCAAAGHDMEATLAAFGSGAARISGETGGRILNIDIGGGTTKLAVVENGTVVSTAALHVGGRLLVADPTGRVIRLEDAGREHAAAAGIALSVGAAVSADQLDDVAELMADIVVDAVAGKAEPSELPYLTEPIVDLSDVDGVVFSGGVAEYVYGFEEQDFGDLGRRLGMALARRIGDGSIPFPLLPADSRIRATALGASEFSVQLSGTTCYISDADALLPRRNLQVVRPVYVLDDDIDVESVAAAVHRHLQLFGAAGADRDIVLAMNWTGELSHPRLHAFGRAVVAGLADRIADGRPVLLAVDADVGRSLGALMREELGVTVEILVVDGLTLVDFDYIDLGHRLELSGVIPVTIKSLVF